MFKLAKWTLKLRKWSILWWAVGIVALVFITLIFYPTIRGQSGQLDQSFSNLPQSAKALFTDTQDIFSPVGYLSSQLFYLMLPMLFSIMTIGLGAGLVAREESDGTIELLLGRPVSRARLLAGKALAGLAITAVVGAAVTLFTLVLCRLINMGVELPNITVAMIYTVELAALYGAIAFAVAALGRVGRLAAIGVAALVALGSYIIASLASVVGWLKTPADFLPNHYYRPGDILVGNYSWRPLVVFGLIILALGFLAWLAFRRRDLQNE